MILAVFFVLYGQVESITSEPLTQTVSVRVESSSDLKSAVLHGYFNQELRKLEQIQIDSHEPQWTIHVLEIPIQSALGLHIGYAYSFVLTYNWYPPFQDRTMLEFMRHIVYWTGTDLVNTYNMITSVVFELDVNFLEPMRQGWREVHETYLRNQVTK